MYKTRKVKVPDEPDKAFAQALKTAFNIISYKDNTEHQLREKLTERGYGEETVGQVVSYMMEKGFVDDRRMIYRLAQSLAQSRLYGRRRIMQELKRRHFAPDVLDSFDFDCEELEDVDFPQCCLRLIKKRGGQRDEKTYAFLVRYGHTPTDIKNAYRLLTEEAEGED